LASFPNSESLTAGLEYDPVGKKFLYNTPKDEDYNYDVSN
jgi:hypothetical protein